MTAQEIASVSQLDIYENSVSNADGRTYALAKHGEGKVLCIVSSDGDDRFEGASESLRSHDGSLVLQTCRRSAANTRALQSIFSWLAPRTLGLAPSVGCGDRLGLATPGHVRAVRGHKLAPIFPQQSIREMTRTARTPDDVMFDAVWGVFEEGWRDGFGADADHLKTYEDIDRTVSSGFTFFTIDPSEYVDNAADAAGEAELRSKSSNLPWDDLESTAADLQRRYVGGRHGVKDLDLEFSEETFLRAAVKYSAAVAHTSRMHRHLVSRMDGGDFELEMSVDETETPTSILEHYFVASELRRLGVPVVSLAPRFVGRLEKGVDYIGDLSEFERSLVEHVAVAVEMGPYKLSLHSGSDKFGLYPIFARHAGRLFHLKTAGTSYLEALRAIASIDSNLFRRILKFAIERYDTDKASYHVSADPTKVPNPNSLADHELSDLLDEFDARQVLHVTFGSVLTSSDFQEAIREALIREENIHYEVIRAHFDRHLAPFDALR